MTEQIKSVIENLTSYVDYGSYNEEKIDDDIRVAIRSLKAWEEVIKELEEQLHASEDDSNWKNATINAICIINQKLAEIEE